MSHTESGLSIEDAFELEQELIKDGYRKCSSWQSLRPGYYAIRSSSGRDLMSEEKVFEIRYEPH